MLADALYLLSDALLRLCTVRVVGRWAGCVGGSRSLVTVVDGCGRLVVVCVWRSWTWCLLCLTSMVPGCTRGVAAELAGGMRRVMALGGGVVPS